MARRKLVAGNWKMHGTSADLGEVSAVSIAAETAVADVALCLPATLIERAVRAAPGFAIGGQDVHQADKGAHTGCVSAAMLLDAGARLTIVGHSERREAQGEIDADVKAKAEAALAAGLSVILCVGESDSVRDAGNAVGTVCGQLNGSLPSAIESPDRLAIAYEPIWAIGTGKVPSTAADDALGAAGVPHGGLWRGRRAGSHPLWRVGQAVECGRDFRRCRCRRRIGGRGKPQGGRFHPHRRSGVYRRRMTFLFTCRSGKGR